MPIWVIFVIFGCLSLIVCINALCRMSKKRDQAEAAYWEENLGDEV